MWQINAIQDGPKKRTLVKKLQVLNMMTQKGDPRIKLFSLLYVVRRLVCSMSPHLTILCTSSMSSYTGFTNF